MTPEQLKASILQYAVEGKLVKQNPNDEPASELIKKIENEKNELVKEGKISKLRKASPISDEEKAFRIPNNWKWVRLEEIAQLNTGTTPSIGKSRYEGNYIPFIKPGDISSKGINYNNFGLSKDGLKHGRLIDENSLLTVCIGGSTGKTYYTDRAISCNQQINASTPYKGVSVMFLFYEMLSNHFQEEIHQHASGSATPIINKTKFGNLCLPLPPLEEQKRIVTKIEKLMPLVDEYAESYNRLQKIDNEFEDKLKQSVLQYAMEGKLVKQNPSDEPASELIKKIENEKAELIKEGKIKKGKPLPPITDDEKPFDIPDSWEWVRFNDIGIMKNGKTPKKTDVKSNARYPYFKVKDMNINSLYMKIVENYVDEKYESQIFPKNTIIYPKNGGAVLTNKKRILIQDSLVDLNTGGIIPYENINFKFLFYMFQSFDIKKYVKGSAVPTINAKKLRETVVPLPPLSEQSRIAAKIAQLFALLRKVETSTRQYAKLQTLLKSKVLDLAMRGKLDKQDPNDEPASVLLEKIKAEKQELIKEKKIKKTKPLPPITDDEKPFAIPDSWEWVRLGNIGDWGAGATPSRQHPEYYGGDVLWLKTGDLNDGVIQDTSEKITEAGVANSSVKVNQPGNILIAMYGATIGKLGIVGKTLVTNQACCGCTPFKGIYNLYLFYYLLSARNRLIELGSGGAQPNISKTKIENFVFPLPPLEEQKRIVIKIEKLMNSMSNLSK